MKKIRYSLIGCGNIAGNYKNSQILKGIYTHAEAFSKIKNFEPIACFDLDIKKALKFKKKWAFKYASNNLDFLDKLNNELIIVTASTNSHYEILEKILKVHTKPKLVLCEKPLTTNYEECLSINKKFSKSKILLAANFHRRCDETILFIKKNIENNLYGKFRVGYCIYNKGILNSGSHIIDLINFLFGKARVIYSGNKIFDFKKNDPSVPFVLAVKNNNIYFLCSNSQDSPMLEVKFIFSKKIIETYDGGITWIVKSNKSKNIMSYDYSFFNYKDNFLKKTYKKTFVSVAKNIFNSINYKNKPFCSVEDALTVHKIIKKILLDAK
jgi:predicted dehydrogenase